MDTYKIGDTKEVDLGSYGIHTVRIANMSECTTETSETACGFVVEFSDIIDNHVVKSANTNVGGWRESEIRSYINNDIFNALPSICKMLLQQQQLYQVMEALKHSILKHKVNCTY